MNFSQTFPLGLVSIALSGIAAKLMNLYTAMVKCFLYKSCANRFLFFKKKNVPCSLMIVMTEIYCSPILTEVSLQHRLVRVFPINWHSNRETVMNTPIGN